MLINNSQIKAKTRDSNIELYRIIVMMLIVAHHYMGHSELISLMNENPSSSQTIMLSLIGMWGKTGINAFVLITGYFMCKSSISIQKFLRLLLQVYFYNIVLTIFLYYGVHMKFTLKDLADALLPIRNIQNDFVACFLMFYLFIPFINILIQHIGKKLHLRLILLSVLVYSFFPSFMLGGTDFNYVNWFIVLYFISSYMRLYPCKKDTSLKFWGICSLVCVFLSMLTVCFFLEYYHSFEKVFLLVTDSNKLLPLATAISSFMFFKNLKLGGHISWINKIASTTFGVLLIHSNSEPMRRWLWDKVIDCAQYWNSPGLFLISILIIFLVFGICSFIEYLRKNLIEDKTNILINKILVGDKNNE